MDLNLITPFLPLLTAIVTVPLSSWLTANLLRKKYDTEVEQLRAQVAAQKTDTKGDELKNVREGMSILMDEVVEPLKKELNAIRREMARFRKAFKEGNNCKHFALCPILHELQRTETVADGNKQPDNRHGQGGRDPT
ncbi:MAG: hypothetical protein R3Y50_06170 [Rikenellaceae bacterium]